MLDQAGEITFGYPDDYFWELTEVDRGNPGLVAKRCKRCARAEQAIELWFEGERKRDARCPLCGAIVHNQNRHKGPDLRSRKGDRHKSGRKDPRYNTADRATAPFIAIDGEGAGTNEHGQQNYLYMATCDVSGEVISELFEDNRALSTKECLEYILKLPKHKLIVGFHFDYDVTMILRDLPIKQQRRLFLPLPRRNNPNNEECAFYTYWQDYAIQYIPYKHLMVSRRIDRNVNQNIPETTRTINFVQGYFSGGLVDVAQSWCGLDACSIAELEKMKAARPSFESITPEIKSYCQKECQYLAVAMHKFREIVLAGNAALQERLPNVSLIPRDWQGPGPMTQRLLASLGIPKRDDLPEHDPEFMEAARASFSAGRTEIALTGRIDGPVYAYDLNSAYPAAILQLPCQRHTRWCKVTEPAPGSLYFARLSWKQPARSRWGAFQVRSKFQTLFAPLSGAGWYWSPEIEAAGKLRAKVQLHEIWQAERCCDCHPFAAIKSIYDYRKSLDNDQLEYPIKLVLNTLYGKFSQRIGAAPYYDPIAAGLITSIVRSRLIEAISLDPEAVIMVATDAVYSTRPLALEIDKQLGHWKLTKHLAGAFVVQPGVWWPLSEASGMFDHKTRGIPQRAIVPMVDQFYDAWDQYIRFTSSKYSPNIEDLGQPTVEIPYQVFIPLKLSLHPEMLMLYKIDPASARSGQWIERKHPVRFNWRTKRRLGGCTLQDGHVKHWPYPDMDGESGTAFDGAELDRLMAWQNETEYAYPDSGYSPLDFIPKPE